MIDFKGFGGKVRSLQVLQSGLLAIAILAAALTFPANPAQAQRYDILPSQIDPLTEHYDEHHVAFKPTTHNQDAPLAIFLPGTNGKGRNTVSMLKFIESRGYRAIGLSFVAAPAIASVCPQDPDPECAAKFREMRIYGTGGFDKQYNSVGDSIEERLVRLLRYLQAKNPEENWSQYLDGDKPRWKRIVVTGQSQGAGMAAYIAKQHEVHRVVLFSAGWDTTGKPRRPVDWFSAPSATPPERWWAAFHIKERTASLIEKIYGVLAIPADHIVRFDRDLPEPFASSTKSPNPFHVIGKRDTRYQAEWERMFGQAED